MRHSDIKLTMGVYTDTRMLPKHAAVNTLPDFVSVHKKVHTASGSVVLESPKEASSDGQQHPQTTNVYGVESLIVSHGGAKGQMAEREGFEPSVHR